MQQDPAMFSGKLMTITSQRKAHSTVLKMTCTVTTHFAYGAFCSCGNCNPEAKCSLGFEPLNTILFLQFLDIMDLHHQSRAMCVTMLGGEDTHPWSATKGGNPIQATIPVKTKNNQQTTHTSHYSSRPIKTSFKKKLR